MNHKRFSTLLIIILAAGTVFRLYGLGYSDFQGDEVSAQNYLFDERTFSEFLLSRTKGPGQYVVSKTTNYYFFDKSRPEFFQRLPWALAGISTIIVAYAMVSRNINKRAGFISATLISLSGLMIAFSRIVQYQAIIMLLTLLGIYHCYLYISRQKDKYLYITAAISGVALLFHYDALSLILPIILILVVLKKPKSLLKYLAITAGVALVFYIPFALSPTFKTTLNYLLGERVVSNFKYDSLFYSIKLLAIYHSREFMLLLGTSFLAIFISFINKGTRQEKLAWIFFTALAIIRISLQESTKLLIYSSTLLMGLIVIFRLKEMLKSKISFEAVIELWFIVSFTSYAVLMTMPLTHIYNFLLPTFILTGIRFAKPRESLRVYLTAFFFVVIVSTISFNNAAFLHTNPEFPWNSKNYIFGKMPQNIAGKEEVKGIFGFPYRREWRKIRTFIDEEELITTYSSNEKYRLAKYYMKPHKWVDENASYYIYIEKPQSLSGTLRPLGNAVYEGRGFAIFKN